MWEITQAPFNLSITDNSPVYLFSVFPYFRWLIHCSFISSIALSILLSYFLPYFNTFYLLSSQSSLTKIPLITHQFISPCTSVSHLTSILITARWRRYRINYRIDYSPFSLIDQLSIFFFSNEKIIALLDIFGFESFEVRTVLYVQHLRRIQ